MASFITAGNATNGLQVSSDNTGILELRTGTGSGTTAVTFSTGQRATFPSTIAVGNATPATTGAGITFPAAQSASSDANTLDDYEEGTWTPAVAFGGNNVGVTYVNRGGWYTKIGNTVNITGWFYLSNKGSSTGDVTITGLPFTEGGKYAVCNFGRFENFTFSVQLNSRIGVGLSQIDLFETSAAGVITSITNSDFTNGSLTYFSATYFV